MTPQEMGRKGGLARGRRLKAGEIPLSGFCVPKPTACPKCGETQPSAREARQHCRKKRTKKSYIA